MLAYPGNIIRCALGTGKDQTFTILIIHNLFKVLDESVGKSLVTSFPATNRILPVAFVVVIHNLNYLLDIVIGGQLHRPDINLDKIVQEIRGKLSDLLGPCSGPHASLTIGANLTKNFSNLGLWNC